MDHMYTSDWHIHSNASYDAELTLEELLAKTEAYGITEFGISDHVNYPYMIDHLRRSKQQFEQHRQEGFHLGVELTPISLFEYDYARTFKSCPDDKNIWLPGYKHPETTIPYPMALPLTTEELDECKVEYVIGAAHFVLNAKDDCETIISDYHRQQLFLACDERVDIIGHPWRFYSNKWVNSQGIYTGLWYDDFTRIPNSMHDEFASAVLQHAKKVEMNIYFFTSNTYPEAFKHRYAEYIRYLFEKGIPITIGSDIHRDYRGYQEEAAKYLMPVGFTSHDFSTPFQVDCQLTPVAADNRKQRSLIPKL